MSRCRANDYLLANDRIRVVVQDIQRNLFGIGQFGGQIIDGDLVRTSGPDRDNFEEWAISLNIESTAHYTSLDRPQRRQQRRPRDPARHRRRRPARLRQPELGRSPASASACRRAADDKDLPVTITTDYILEPGANYVRVETTVQNTSAAGIDIFFGEYINGSGQLELFQSGYGFGEPLVTTACPSSHAQPVQLHRLQRRWATPTASRTATSHADARLEHLHHLRRARAAAARRRPARADRPARPRRSTSARIRRSRRRPRRSPATSSSATARVGASRTRATRSQCLPTGTLSGNVTAGGNPAVRAGVGGDRPGNTVGPASGAARNATSSSTPAPTTPATTRSPCRRGATPSRPTSTAAPYEGGGATPLEHPVDHHRRSARPPQNIALPATGAAAGRR